MLAFVGSLAYSTSVLENIAEVDIFRLLLVALVIGLVLINVLFGLFYYINKLVNREAKLGPLIVSNAIFLSLIAAVVICRFISGILQ